MYSVVYPFAGIKVSYIDACDGITVVYKSEHNLTSQPTIFVRVKKNGHLNGHAFVAYVSVCNVKTM